MDFSKESLRQPHQYNKYPTTLSSILFFSFARQPFDEERLEAERNGMVLANARSRLSCMPLNFFLRLKPNKAEQYPDIVALLP
jgi:hypothetical protein